MQQLYQYIQANDPDVQAELDALSAQQETQQIESQVSSLTVELLDKKIQLKAVLSKSELKPFDTVKVDFETAITNLETQIADLQAQL